LIHLVGAGQAPPKLQPTAKKRRKPPGAKFVKPRYARGSKAVMLKRRN
jgi:hypothetical protein